MPVASLVWVLVACQTGGPTGAYADRVELAEPMMTEEGPLTWLSGFDWHVDGVWIPASRDWGVAGIAGQTCQMDFIEGIIDVDFDLGHGRDVVFDGVDFGGDVDLDGDTTVLIGTSGELSTIGFPSGTLEASWPALSVVDAALSDLGPVVLSENSSCEIEWPDAWGVSQELPPAACQGQMRVDPDGTAFIADGARVWRARPDEVLEIATDVAHLAWSPADQLLYVGSSDDTRVRALDRDGALVWSTDVGGQVEGLDVVGPGRVAISAERTADVGAVLVLLDGEVEVEQHARRTASPLVTGDDGAIVALVGGGRIDFLGLDLDGGGR